MSNLNQIQSLEQGPSCLVFDNKFSVLAVTAGALWLVPACKRSVQKQYRYRKYCTHVMFDQMGWQKMEGISYYYSVDASMHPGKRNA